MSKKKAKAPWEHAKPRVIPMPTTSVPNKKKKDDRDACRKRVTEND